jgi:hypothetical protein
LAFTLESVKLLDGALSPIVPSVSAWREVLRGKALSVGMETVVYFLLRRSEYLPCRTFEGAPSRGLKWDDFKFLDADCHSVGFKQVSIGAADSVSVLVSEVQYGLARSRRSQNILTSSQWHLYSRATHFLGNSIACAQRGVQRSCT